jgi:hypothetical protein
MHLFYHKYGRKYVFENDRKICWNFCFPSKVNSDDDIDVGTGAEPAPKLGAKLKKKVLRGSKLEKIIKFRVKF